MPLVTAGLPAKGPPLCPMRCDPPIRRILSGRQEPPPPSPGRNRPARPALSAEPWTPLWLANGLELYYDTRKHMPQVEDLVTLRQAVRETFGYNE